MFYGTIVTDRNN